MTAPTTFATKALAGAFLASVETDMRRGTWFDPTAGTVVSLGEYAATWLAQRTVKGRPLAPRTLDTYRHSLEAWIVPTLGSRPLGDVGPADVRRWHQFVLSRTGPTAARQAYALLRAVFNTAVSDELVPRNPCRIRGAGQPNSPERPLVDLDVVMALVDAMPEHLKAFTILAFWGHARLGELLGLRVGDFDVAKGTLRIERQVIEVDGEGPRITAPKVGSIRTVHLPVPAVDALAAHLGKRRETRPDSPLFTRPGGTELRAHHVHARWNTARNRVGHPDLHFHDLRHAGLTLSAQSGATVAEVMRRAGHVSTQAAMRYQHAAEERDAEIAALMTSHAARPKGQNN
jgi:integrase